MVLQLAAAQVRGDTRSIERTVSMLLRCALLFSLAVAVLLFAAGDLLGRLIYHSDSAGYYIRVLAPLVPVMYMDIVTDGCLKGLGQMMQSMSFNIAEALIGVLLVITLLPRFALDGYIFVLYFCELFNFTLSITRLQRVVTLRRVLPRQAYKKD